MTKSRVFFPVLALLFSISAVAAKNGFSKSIPVKQINSEKVENTKKQTHSPVIKVLFSDIDAKVSAKYKVPKPIACKNTEYACRAGYVPSADDTRKRIEEKKIQKERKQAN